MNKYIITAVFLLAQLFSFAAPPADPKEIFTSRCASCHNVNKTLTGPALAGVDQRRTIDWIIQFVHSSQHVIRSGDSYANTLFEKYNRIVMPDHTDLSAEDIKGVVEYIKSQSKVTEEKAPFATPGKLRPNYHPLSITGNWLFFSCYLLFVVLMIVALLFAVNVQSLKRKTDKAGKP